MTDFANFGFTFGVLAWGVLAIAACFLSKDRNTLSIVIVIAGGSIGIIMQLVVIAAKLK